MSDRIKYPNFWRTIQANAASHKPWLATVLQLIKPLNLNARALGGKVPMALYIEKSPIFSMILDAQGVYSQLQATGANAIAVEFFSPGATMTIDHSIRCSCENMNRTQWGFGLRWKSNAPENEQMNQRHLVITCNGPISPRSNLSINTGLHPIERHPAR